jgi:hypothetical protein
MKAVILDGSPLEIHHYLGLRLAESIWLETEGPEAWSAEIP